MRKTNVIEWNVSLVVARIYFSSSSKLARFARSPPLCVLWNRGRKLKVPDHAVPVVVQEDILEGRSEPSEPNELSGLAFSSGCRHYIMSVAISTLHHEYAHLPKGSLASIAHLRLQITVNDSP